MDGKDHKMREWVDALILTRITCKFFLRLWMAAKKRHAEIQTPGSLSRRATPAALPPLPTAPPAQRPSVSSTNLDLGCQTHGFRFLQSPIIKHHNDSLSSFFSFWISLDSSGCCSSLRQWRRWWWQGRFLAGIGHETRLVRFQTEACWRVFTGLADSTLAHLPLAL